MLALTRTASHRCRSIQNLQILYNYKVHILLLLKVVQILDEHLASPT